MQMNKVTAEKLNYKQNERQILRESIVYKICFALLCELEHLHRSKFSKIIRNLPGSVGCSVVVFAATTMLQPWDSMISWPGKR